jgi:hypothetical protein
VSTTQDHANAVLALLDADNAAPALVFLDGAVPSGQLPPYVLVYLMLQTPDGLAAPDKVSLDFNSDVVDLWVYCHCVGGNAAAARAVSARVRAALLNVTPTIANRVCFPIRWREGNPPQRDESTGVLVQDLVDVYGLITVPAS